MSVTPSFAVHQFDALPPDTTAQAYRMYVDAFADIARLAAQRHLMTGDEFTAVCTDPRIIKYVATTGSGAVTGMATLTNDLDAWPLVSTHYFAHHWPDLYMQRRIWYLGFACVAHPGVDGHIFESLIEHMSIPVRDAHGMVFMDFCTANVARLIRGIRRTVARLDPDHTFQVYDSQQFWGFDFTAQVRPS